MSQELENILQNEAQRQASVVINDIYEKVVINSVNSKLPEYIFVQYFLPYFTNALPMNQKVITDWISVAGSPLNEVDIIDSSNNVLYTVPALFSNDYLIVNRNNNMSFNALMSEYSLRANYMPVVGEKFLAEALGMKYSELTNQKVKKDDENRWLAIFKRYNITQQEPIQDQQPSPTTQDDIVDYD